IARSASAAPSFTAWRARSAAAAASSLSSEAFSLMVSPALLASSFILSIVDGSVLLGGVVAPGLAGGVAGLIGSGDVLGDVTGGVDCTGGVASSSLEHAAKRLVEAAMAIMAI